MNVNCVSGSGSHALKWSSLRVHLLATVPCLHPSSPGLYLNFPSVVDAFINHVEMFAFKFWRCRTTSLPHPEMPLGPRVSHQASGVTLSQGWQLSGCPARRPLPGSIQCLVSQTGTCTETPCVCLKHHAREQGFGEGRRARWESELQPLELKEICQSSSR